MRMPLAGRALGRGWATEIPPDRVGRYYVQLFKGVDASMVVV